MRTTTLLPLFLALSLATANAGAAQPDPTAVVRETTQDLQGLIHEHRAQYAADKRAFYATVDQTLAPAFDLPYVARAVLGRNWKAATEEQRTRFQAAFKASLIRLYADTLLDNGDARIEWLAALGSDEGTTVKASLLRGNGEAPVALGFELHRAPAGEWQVYDLTVESVSFLASFRAQIAEEVRRSGLDAVIARLEGTTVAANSR